MHGPMNIYIKKNLSSSSNSRGLKQKSHGALHLQFWRPHLLPILIWWWNSSF